MNKPTKMYHERIANIAAFRGCSHNCVYCAFQKSLTRSPCLKCRAFEPHEHLECFERTPPKTKGDEFITIGLCGDVAFASDAWFKRAIEYCEKWRDRTFLLQSKNPQVLQDYEAHHSFFPENLKIGITIETDQYPYQPHIISKAPVIEERYDAMMHIFNGGNIWTTIEPIIEFNLPIFLEMISNLNPSRVYIGYNSRPDVRLSEPPLVKTQELIRQLRAAGLDVREKLMREARR